MVLRYLLSSYSERDLFDLICKLERVMEDSMIMPIEMVEEVNESIGLLYKELEDRVKRGRKNA